MAADVCDAEARQALLLEEVWDRLAEVIDPCSVGRGVPAGLPDMGMVEGLSLTQGDRGAIGVKVNLRVTSPACTFQPYFEREVRSRLAAIDRVGTVDIAWSRSFDWTDADMSVDLRLRLKRKQHV